MKVSYNWLKEFVDCDFDPYQVAERLTMAGAEVESVRVIGADLEGVVVGKIVSCEPDERRKHWKWCSVSLGRGKVRVLCGAPNVRTGAKVAVALPGSTLPGVKQRIRARKIRGRVSEALICSEKDLGLGEDHSGILILPSGGNAGQDLQAALALPDFVLDIEVTPNRPDLLSVRGVARELAALTGQRFKTAQIVLKETGPPIEEMTSVTVHDYYLCPRYCARLLRGLKIGTSPFWLRHRLFISGLRPINNVVDATNYVLLEIGQPLHAFDFNALAERRIVVRPARAGEDIVTIDDTDRKLSPADLVIADGISPVAIAGVMGGRRTEVRKETVDVLLESACFHPVSIRRSSKSLALATEASKRFERGADPLAAPEALHRASDLIVKLAGGRTAVGWIDKKKRSFPPHSVSLQISRMDSLLGVSIKLPTVRKILRRLGLKPGAQRGERISFLVPSWRPDLRREEDLIEEVARLYGYDRIPAALPVSRVVYHKKENDHKLTDQTRDLLCSLGLNEVITYSFTNAGEWDRLQLPPDHPLRLAPRIVNPVSQEQELLRTSLIPGFLKVMSLNLNQNRERIEIFEIGKVFSQVGLQKLPQEKTALAIALSQPGKEACWCRPPPPLDFFSLKGLLELLFLRIGVKKFRFLPDPHPSLQLGQSAAVIVEDEKVGIAGTLGDRVRRQYNLPAPLYLAELDFDHLISKVREDIKYQPLPLYPGVRRDLAVILEDDITYNRLEEAIESLRPEMLKSYYLFDVYTGPPIPAGEKSIALSLHYRSPYGTLLEKDVSRVHNELKKALARKLHCYFRE